MSDISNEETKIDDEIELENGTYNEPLVVNFENVPVKAYYKMTLAEGSDDFKKDLNASIDLEMNIAKMTAKTFASFKQNLSGNKIQKYVARYNRNHHQLMQLMNDEILEGQFSSAKKYMQLMDSLMIKIKASVELATGDGQNAKVIKVPEKVANFLMTLNVFADPDESQGGRNNPYNKLSDILDFVFTDEEQEIMNDIQEVIETELKVQKDKYDIVIKNNLQSNLIKQLGLIPEDLVGKVKSIIAISDEEIKDYFISHNKKKPTDFEKMVSEGHIEFADVDFSNKLQEIFINSKEEELHSLIDAIIRKNQEEKEKLPERIKDRLANFKEKATIDANLSSAILGIKNPTDDMAKIFQDSSSADMLQNFIEETIDLLNAYNVGIIEHILPEYSLYTSDEDKQSYEYSDEKDAQSLYERRKDAEAAFTNPTADEIYSPRTSFISGLTSDRDEEHSLINDEQPQLVEDVFLKTIQFFFNENIITEQDFRFVADYFKNNPKNDELPPNIKKRLIKPAAKPVVNEVKEKPKVVEPQRPVQLISEKSYALADKIISPSILNDILHEQLKNNKDDFSNTNNEDIKNEKINEMPNEETELVEHEDGKEEFIVPAILDAMLEEQLKNNKNDYPPARLIPVDILNTILNEQINDDLIQENFFSIQSVMSQGKESSLTNFNVLIEDIGNYGQLIGSESDKAKKLSISLVNKIRSNAAELANCV